MTKAELLAGLDQISTLRAELETVQAEKDLLHKRERELRRLLSHLEEPDEVFEGQPVRAWGTTNFGCSECGDDGEYRQAYVSPVYEEREYADDEPMVPTHFLLKLSGAANHKAEREWKRYADRDQAVLAAKRFAAHGLVPEPDALKEEELKRAHPMMTITTGTETVNEYVRRQLLESGFRRPEPIPNDDLGGTVTVGNLELTPTEFDADVLRLEAEGRADWELSLNLAKAKLADVQARIYVEGCAVENASDLLRKLWAERERLNSEIAALENRNPGGD